VLTCPVELENEMIVHRPETNADHLQKPKHEGRAFVQELFKVLAVEGEGKAVFKGDDPRAPRTAINKLQFSEEISGMQEGKSGFPAILQVLGDFHPAVDEKIEVFSLLLVFKDDVTGLEPALDKFVFDGVELDVAQRLGEYVVPEAVQLVFLRFHTGDAPAGDPSPRPVALSGAAMHANGQ
jgi:hypothetical protein